MSNKTGFVFAIVVGAVVLMMAVSLFNRSHESLPESSAQAFESQLDQPGLVLAKFGAPWCPPCREVDRELSKLASVAAGEVHVVTINVDNEPALSRKFNIQSIPRIMLFQDGNKVKDHTGFVTFDVMQGWVRSAKTVDGTAEDDQHR